VHSLSYDFPAINKKIM